MQAFSEIFNKLLKDPTISKRLADGFGIGIVQTINIITQSPTSKIILFSKENNAIIYSVFQNEHDFSAFIDQCITVLTEYQKEKGMDTDG